MTFIINLVEKNYIFQVSDRKLTRILNNKPIGYIDEQNKAVFFNNRMVFSYTGLAKINGKSTALWLAEKLSDVKVNSTSEAFNLIKEEATKAFQNIPNSQLLSLSFIAVGWVKLPDSSQFEPMLCRISNIFDDKGNPLPNIKRSFNIHWWLTPNIERSLVFFPAGQPISKHERVILSRLITRRVQKSGTPEEVICILINFVKELAENNSAIGKSLMGLCIPKRSVEQQSNMVLTQLPSSPIKINDNSASFFYVPEKKGQLIGYGPYFVDQGMATIDFTVKEKTSKNRLEPFGSK